MRQALVWVFLLCNTSVFSFASDTYNLRLADIRSLGLGGNEVTQSSLFNPALVAFNTIRNAELGYFNRYGLKELSSGYFSVNYPNQYLSAAVNISTFGYEKYRESLFRFPLAKKLSDRWWLGVSVQYALLQTVLYEEQQVSRLSTDVGILFNPVDNLLIGLLISDLPSVRFGDNIASDNSNTPYFIQLGFQWDIINSLLITCSAKYDDEANVCPDFGIEYKPYEQFMFRMGMRGTPLTPSFGVGYVHSFIHVNTVFMYHSILGVSSGIGLAFSF